MRKRQCTRCLIVKDDNEFSPQKTKPIFKYAWCDGCRDEVKAEKQAAQAFVTARNRMAIAEDYRMMREKAVELRKFSPDQCTELKKRISNGEKVINLAKEFNCSDRTIRRAANGYV